MNCIFISVEAKLFCFVIIIFLLVFKLKSTLEVSKKTIVSYLISAFGVLGSLLSGFISGSIIKILCYAVSGICYAVAAFLIFKTRKSVITVLISVVFGIFTFYSLRFGLNIATYVLVIANIATLIFEQFGLITTDNLTGLYNLYARKLEIEEQEREYRNDHNDSFYVISCDLDKFKTINDTWGHQEGDRALELVAKALTKVSSKFNAKVFRVGGDEFQIIADTSEEKEAEKIEKTIQEEFDNINFRDDFDIEISIGKVLYNGAQETDELLAVADSRLYAEKAKRKGKTG